MYIFYYKELFLILCDSGFDLPTFVQAAFQKLKSDVVLTTGVTIGNAYIQFSRSVR